MTKLAGGVMAAGLACAVAGAALAQAERSVEFAEQSVNALESGEADMATILALRGLPADPGEADFEAFPEAYEALFRSIAARILKVDRTEFQHYAVNSTGDRAVIGPGNGPQDGSEDADPYSLFDPRDGTKVADLVPWDIPMSFIYYPGQPPAFSPDGELVALWAMDEGEVRLFDTEDGRAHPPLAVGGNHGEIADFSPDGRLLAAISEDTLVVWDLETRERISGSWPDNVGLGGLAIWLSDGSLVIGRSERENYEVAAVTLTRYVDGGEEGAVRIEATGPSFDILQSPAGPEVLVTIGEHQFLANPEAGASLRIGRAGDSFYNFTRDGEALGVLIASGLGNWLSPKELDLRLTDLEGNEIASEPRDWAAFDQYPVTMEGNVIGMGSVRPYNYQAQDLPEGQSLYDMVWSTLSEEERQEIDADRVNR